MFNTKRTIWHKNKATSYGIKNYTSLHFICLLFSFTLFYNVCFNLTIDRNMLSKRRSKTYIMNYYSINQCQARRRWRMLPVYGKHEMSPYHNADNHFVDNHFTSPVYSPALFWNYPYLVVLSVKWFSGKWLSALLLPPILLGAQIFNHYWLKSSSIVACSLCLLILN